MKENNTCDIDGLFDNYYELLKILRKAEREQ